MRPAEVDFVIMAFGNPDRLRRVLEAWNTTTSLEFWPRVVESPSTETVALSMASVAADYGVHLTTRPAPGEMQQTAEFAVETSKSPWVVILPDDVFPTPGALQFVQHWLSLVPPHVGATQIPYWNWQDLRSLVGIDWEGPSVANIITDSTDDTWLRNVPLNPHWVGPAFYVNVNGAGFGLRREAWKDVGGFPQGSWNYDETISVKLWLSGRWTIMSVPGPPLVHQGGQSVAERGIYGTPDPDVLTVWAWETSMDMTKAEADLACRRSMAEWGRRTGFRVL